MITIHYMKTTNIFSYNASRFKSSFKDMRNAKRYYNKAIDIINKYGSGILYFNIKLERGLKIWVCGYMEYIFRHGVAEFNIRHDGISIVYFKCDDSRKKYLGSASPKKNRLLHHFSVGNAMTKAMRDDSRTMIERMWKTRNLKEFNNKIRFSLVAKDIKIKYSNVA
jgi:hypothetical protein